MERFVGKVAVVTGASSGIGYAVAKRLVEKGMVVAGLSRNQEKMQELAKELGIKGSNLHAIATDVTLEKSILEAFDYVRKNLGPVHVLVNAAGMSRFATLTKGATEEWRAILNTNILGLSITTREAIASMAANKINGHVIHMNSITGHYHLRSSTLFYGASKFAITSLTESLRKELNEMKSRIKVTSISPGVVDTPMLVNTLNGAEGAKEFIDNFNITNPALHVNDVVDAVIYVLDTPPHVQVHEIILRPLGEHI